MTECIVDANQQTRKLFREDRREREMNRLSSGHTKSKCIILQHLFQLERRSSEEKLTRWHHWVTWDIILVIAELHSLFPYIHRSLTTAHSLHCLGLRFRPQHLDSILKYSLVNIHETFSSLCWLSVGINWKKHSSDHQSPSYSIRQLPCNIKITE